MSALNDKIQLASKRVYDPEIPVKVTDLGLIYEIKEDPAGYINIQMTGRS